MKVTNELLTEGITAELLKSVEKTQMNLPAIMETGGTPTNFIKAGAIYWGFDAQQNVLKNDKGKPTEFPKDAVLIGKARYYLTHKEQMIETATQKLVEKEKVELLKKANDKINAFDKVYFDAYENYLFKPLADIKKPFNVLRAFAPEKAEAIKERSKKLLEDSPAYQAEAEMLKSCIDTGDYDSLCLHFSDNMGLIMSAKIDNPEQMKVLKDNFSADKIADTIDNLKRKGHLWAVCRMKASKDFF
jgi:hypothetical protein